MLLRREGAPSVLAGRYLLGTEIGRGGMAVVYRGRDTVLQRDVAVKVMRDLLIDPEGRERFEREGQTLAKLSHSGLVPVFDAGVLDDRPFLVLEFVDGETLSDRRRAGPMPMPTVLTLGAELAGVLSYIHGLGITHRDVKPGNVLIDTENRVRLADFGLARIAGSAHHTAPGFTMGTAAYMSPEQVRGDRIGQPSDIYALGLILIEALTGEVVYQGTPAAAALARLVTPPTAQLRLPAPMHHLLAAMTADRPQDRPGADDVRRRLHAMPGMLTAGSLESEADTQPLALTRRWRFLSRPRPRWLLGTAGLLLAAPALVIGNFLGDGQLGSQATGHPSAGAATAHPVATQPSAPPPSSTPKPALKPSTATVQAAQHATTARSASTIATRTAKAEAKHGKGKGKAKGKGKDED